MVSVLAYKVALLILVAVSGAGSGATAYYYQGQTSDLNNKVTDLNTKVTTNNNQVSQLQSQISQLQSQSAQLSNQNSQLISQNNQLQSQITQLQTQIAKLNHTTAQTTQANSTLISTGSIDVVGYGAVQYVSFTSNPSQIELNVSFSVAYGAPIVVMLLNPGQRDDLNSCNCIFYGNYTASSWQSPLSASYHALVSIPTPGLWYVAFLEQPGTGSDRTIGETLFLISSNVSLTSSVIASEVTLTNGCCPSTDYFSAGAPPTAIVSLGSIPYSGHIVVSWIGSSNPSTRYSFTVQVNGVNTSTDATATGGFTIPVFANAESNAWFTCYDYSTDQFGAHCDSNLTYSITYWHS